MNLIILPGVDSTNSYVLRLIEEGLAPEGTVVLAWEQTSGRGQRGSSWISQPGLGLYFSLILTPPSGRLADIPGLIKALALGVITYLESKDLPEILKIKWPNDILSGDRKLCGILMESVIKGDRLSAIVFGAGINLNHNQFSGHFDRKPVSLKMLKGKTYDPEEEAADLFPVIMEFYRKWLNTPGLLIAEEYNRRLYGRDKECRFSLNGEEISAWFHSVNEQGQAVIGKSGKTEMYPHPYLRLLGTVAV